MEAKVFLDKKQDKHFKKFGVYADVNSKIAEWMEEYTNQRIIEELNGIVISNQLTINKLSSDDQIEGLISDVVMRIEQLTK
jgi:hypothetical protein